MKILVVNAGSSSLKCWYDDLREDALDAAPPQPLWSTHVDWNEKTLSKLAMESATQASSVEMDESPMDDREQEMPTNSKEDRDF